MSAFADDERLRSIPATARSVLRDIEAPPSIQCRRSRGGNAVVGELTGRLYEIDRNRLTYSHRPPLEVSVASGFTSTSHFAQWSRRFHGMRPSELRERSRKGLA
jgi:AraC-like DNA-binding protein